MTMEAWTAVAVTVGVFVLLAATRVAPYLILMGGVAVLLVLGVLSPEQALSGFANPGMITVATLFVVVAGLRQTGVLSRLGQSLLGRPAGLTGAMARLSLPVLGASAFLNNTPVVAMLMPVVVEWARAIRISQTKLLIPLSYAAILGGLCSLLGTSTNLVVNGLLIQTGRPGLNLFDITWVGLPAAVAGLAFLLGVGRYLLPSREGPDMAHVDPREYTVEMVVTGRGALVGKTIQEAGMRRLMGVFLAEIDRQGHVIPAVRPDQVLQAGDQLIFVGRVDAIADLQKIAGLAPATRQVFKLDSPRAERVFAEAVVSGTSPLLGTTIRDGRFRTRYNAVVLAVSRNGERIQARIGDIVLQPGDGLLLETTPSFVEQQRYASDFYLVSVLEGDGPPTGERTWVALAILVGMVALAASGLSSVLVAALLAAGLMLLTRCCSEEAARRSLDLPLLITIAAALGLGQALLHTGAAVALAQGLLQFAGDHPWLALAIVYGMTTILSEFVTNNAAAVIVFPIAISVAEQLQVNIMPFVIVTMIAASASFATPLGYQTNLMVYGAGGYRFHDFLRIGLPMSALIWTVSVLITPLMWPF